MASQTEYKKLPGRGNRRAHLFDLKVSRSRLWLGSDHLLCVDLGMGHVEHYKRFYFRDIQAFILRPTSRRLSWNVVWCTLAVLALLPAIMNAGELWFLWVSIGTLFMIAMMVNWFILGPTCTCHLRTGVQTLELPSLQRLRRARQVIATLQPLIADAQSGWTTEPGLAGGNSDIPPVIGGPDHRPATPAGPAVSPSGNPMF